MTLNGQNAFTDSNTELTLLDDDNIFASQLQTMTKAELMQTCRRRNIKYNARMTVSELATLVATS